MPQTRVQFLTVICGLGSVALLLAGCGKARESAETAQRASRAVEFARDLEDGKATVQTDKGEFEIETDEDRKQVRLKLKGKQGEEVTVGRMSREELAGLDVPVYPGADIQSSHKMSAPDSDRVVANLKTPDSFDKVTDFYQQQYPDAKVNTVSSSKTKIMLISAGEEPDLVSITISREQSGDTTKVLVARQQPRGEAEKQKVNNKQERRPKTSPESAQ